MTCPCCPSYIEPCKTKRPDHRIPTAQVATLRARFTWDKPMAACQHRFISSFSSITFLRFGSLFTPDCPWPIRDMDTNGRAVQNLSRRMEKTYGSTRSAGLSISSERGTALGARVVVCVDWLHLVFPCLPDSSETVCLVSKIALRP